MEQFCHQCGSTLREGFRFCEKCGTRNDRVPETQETVIKQEKETEVRKKISWGWVFRSMGLILVSYFIVFILLAAIIAINGDDISDLSTGVIAIIGLIIALFMGSFWSAYISPGRTVKEPAIAMTIMLVAGNLAMGNIFGAALGWILPWFIAIAGARLGEVMQNRKYN